MDTISFETSTSRIEDYQVIDIFINGTHLSNIIKQIELPYAMQEGVPQLAGAYEGLPAIITLPPAVHFYGQASEGYSYPNDKVGLLEYGQTGIPGDWTVSAKIEKRGPTIIWSEFEKPQITTAMWTYEGLKFTFDLEQYSDALDKAAKKAY